jgi:phosphopantetheine adenylyltransferase
MIVVEGNFDPITETELSVLEAAASERIQRKMIFVQLKENDAVLGLAERMYAVCLAGCSAIPIICS